MATSPLLASTELREKQDPDWVRQSLFLPVRGSGGGGNSRAEAMRYSGNFSYGALSFADTSLGGNRSINPKPQFTLFADPSMPSLLAKHANSNHPDPVSTMGMGLVYGEIIDTNAQRIYMQFGVPGYNSLSNFFSTFYDPGHASLVNTGAGGSDVLYNVGRFVGFITAWRIIPELCLFSLFYGTAKKAIAMYQRRPLSKFMYMQPTMPLYWSTVQVIINAIAVNMKLVQGTTPGQATRDPGGKVQVDPTKYGQSEADMKELNRILPDIMIEDGGIDARAVANRYQRLSNAHERRFNDIMNRATSADDAQKQINAYLESNPTAYDIKPRKKLSEYISDYINGVPGKGVPTMESNVAKGLDNAPATNGTNAPDTTVKDATNQAAEATLGSVMANLWTGITEYWDGCSDYMTAELRDGSAFVSFVVDYESTVSESFSHSTRESDIASKMNAKANEGRSRLFNLAGGNVGEGLIADTLESIVKGVGDVIDGVASSVGFSGLSMLNGKGFVDIPEFYNGSSASFPSSSYSMELRTWAGNKPMILSYLMFPLAMIIAAAAPRTVGRNAYAGPFLCKLWQKGRTQIQLGMITSCQITRGAGNVGWSVNQLPIGIDVSFTVTNLSKVLHVPIVNDVSITDPLGISLFDEDNNFTDYMAILGSLGLSEQYYFSSRWRLRWANKMQNYDTFLSVDNFMTWAADTTPGSIISVFVRGANLGQMS